MKLGLRGALGIVLSAVFLYFAFRNVPFESVLENIRRANLPLLLLATAVATSIFPLRARRWRPILDPVAPNLPFGILWRPTAIGMMLNNVTPARAGEIARAFLLSRSTDKVPFPAALASLAVDRLLDALIVFLLMFAAMLDPVFPRGAEVFGRSLSSIAIGGIIAIGAVLAIMYAVVLMPARVLGIYGVVARRAAPRFEARGRAALESLVEGLTVLRTPSRFGAVIGWTLLHWLVHALACWIAFKAVNIDVPYSAALFIQGLIAIGVAAPQAPGFFGVFEFVGKEGLRVYGVPGDLAATWAISFHFLTYVPITVIGAIYFIRAGLTFGELSRAKSAAGRPAET